MKRSTKNKSTNEPITLHLRNRTENDDLDWQEIEIDSGSRLFIRPIDPEIIKEMPSETTTFIERGLFGSFRRSTSRKAVNGNGH